ncbi:5314_t:CDS:2, partial [Funneliformis caledonium]
LASYGGHILIPQCSSDNSVGGCLTQNDKSVYQVRDSFVLLLRGILASGVMARRILLAGEGIEMPVQNLVKGVIGEKLVFGKGYWVTIIFDKLSSHVRWQIIEKSLAGLSELQIAKHLGVSKSTITVLVTILKSMDV